LLGGLKCWRLAAMEIHFLKGIVAVLNDEPFFLLNRSNIVSVRIGAIVGIDNKKSSPSPIEPIEKGEPFHRE